MWSDARKDFITSSSDAKRIARSASKKNKTGKGAVRLPMDCFDKEGKKKYMEPSTITTTDLSAPMPLKAFKKLRKENQKMQLEIWGNVYGHSSGAIGKVLGCAQSTAYDYLRESGLTDSFIAKAKEDTETGKCKERKMNLMRLLADKERGQSLDSQSSSGTVSNAENNPLELVPFEMQQTTPPEHQNVSQTTQNRSRYDETIRDCVLNVTMEGRFIKGAVQGLEDNKTYRIEIQEV